MKKVCSNCKKTEPEVKFTKLSRYTCKGCVRLRNQQYSITHGASLKFIPIVTKTRKQCCRCKKLKLLKHYTNASRGRMGKAAYCKPCMSKYQLKYTSKEIRKQKTQVYRDSNRTWWRSLHRINQFNRRKKIKAVSDGTVTPLFVQEIYTTEICYYCKDQIPEKYRTLEHKQPLNKDGRHSVDNIVMACLECNSSKRDKTEEQFKTYRECQLAQQ